MAGVPQATTLTARTQQQLAQLAELPTADHVAVFDGIHQSLAEALSQVADQPPSSPAGHGTSNSRNSADVVEATSSTRRTDT